MIVVVMKTALQALAEIYRASAAGRTGAERDFTIDYERLLRRAGLDDGDARELAERDLATAEATSNGALRIDRHPRSGLPQRVRLSAATGETWLFEMLGLRSPAAARQQLADVFLKARQLAVPDPEAWKNWLDSLAAAALSGASVHPFAREDPDANQRLLDALHGVLNWPHESLIRYASVRLTGDSKALESLRPRLEAALRALTTREDTTLETYGILDVPRSVTVHGPLVLHFSGASLDLTPLAGPVSLSAIDLDRAIPEVRSRALLTVENESVFLELARRNPGVLLIHTSFPGSATRLLLEKLPADLSCHHFGDTDPAGFDILRDLRERTGRHFQPFLMSPTQGGEPFTAAERRTLDRLLAGTTLADLHPLLHEMKSRGTKGRFEQEHLDISEIINVLSRF